MRLNKSSAVAEMGDRWPQYTPAKNWVGVWSKEGTVRHCQSKEASILWSHHEETRELPGERNNARNNARCTQARKTTHGLDRQQVVDRTLCGIVNQNDRRQRSMQKVCPWCGQPSDRGRLRNRTSRFALAPISTLV